MTKEYTIQEALKLAIQGEKESMDFYRKAASIATNERTRKIFDLLANEEVGHLKAFFDHYKGGEFGDLRAYVESPPDEQTASYKALLKALQADMPEQAALEIALKEEKACIDHYSVLVKDIIDPLVRAVFERVIKETQGHYDMIEDEYMHVMKMVDKSDQDTYVRE